MNLRTNEDPEIPILPNKVRKRRIRCLGFWRSLHDDEVAKPEFVFSPWFCLSFVAVSLLIFPYLYFIGGRVIDFHKPEFRLDSVYVCPIDTSFVIWDLKFDITNTDNHTLCIPPFVVSVFSSSSYINRTSHLLTKATVIPTNVCLRSTSHTSVQALVDDSLSSQMITNGTIRLDLKFHALFRYAEYGDRFYGTAGDMVCKDAKVAFSTSSCNSSCGCMVGDPFQCSYESYK